jgi:DNA-binding transcriptional MocR family regulator
MDQIAFARGVPAPEMLPVEDLRAAAATAFERHATGVLSYGTGGGWPALRERLAARHGARPEQVVVTSGSLQGFALLAEVLARRAKQQGRRARVIVERPTYDRPLLILERLGIDVVPVGLDPDTGVDLDELAAAMADGADLAYLIPTFQNPSGATVPLEHRVRIVELAREHEVLVLEDDPYGELHFDTPAPTRIHALSDGDGSIAFSGSFSKTVAPGLRVGWLVLPVELAGEVATLANDTYISGSFLAQATIDGYLDAGRYEPNVERVRELLRERCATTVAALATHLPEATFAAPGGGYFIWIRLPGSLDAAEVARAGGEHGVSFVPGASFGAGWDDWARLAFSSPAVDQLEDGIRRLASACAAVQAPV